MLEGTSHSSRESRAESIYNNLTDELLKKRMEMERNGKEG